MPNSTSQCPQSWLVSMTNDTMDTMTSVKEDSPAGYLQLYELSYIWYSLLGVSLTMMAGLVTSLVWTQDITRLDKRLLSPALPSLIQVGTRTLTRTQLLRPSKSQLQLEPI